MPPSGSAQIKQPKLLIVEGKDEENFFAAALTAHLGLADVQVLSIGGKTLLTRNLNALTNDPAFSMVQSLAIVRDADLTPAGSAVSAAASAFESIRYSLTAPGVQLACPAGHALFSAGPPRVGVFIMPDGIADGMLETLCVSAASSLPEYACVTSFFACCQGHGAIPNNIHKARAHAFLASRVESDRRVGEAALAGYWPFAEPAFHPLWTFLQAL